MRPWEEIGFLDSGILPHLLSGKEPTRQCRSYRFDPWVGKIPWRRIWQPTPVFLPGEFHGQRSLAGYGPWGCKSTGRDWVTKQQQQPLPPPSPQLEVWLFPSGGRGWGVHSSPKEGHDQVQVPRSSVPAAEITAHRTHVNPWIDEPRVEGDGRRQNQVSALLPEPLKEDRPASVLKSQSEKYSSQWVLSG